MSKAVKRLADEFQPSHYILELNPDRMNKTFSGTVIVSGRKINRPSKRLTFHQVGLKITHASITKHDKKGDSEIELKRINRQKTFDEVRLHANQLLYPGN